MEKYLSLNSFIPADGSVWEPGCDAALMGCEEGTGARIFLDEKIVSSIPWQDYKYLALEVNSKQYWSLVFMYEFWEIGNETEEPDITIRFSFLPNQVLHFS